MNMGGCVDHHLRETAGLGELAAGEPANIIYGGLVCLVVPSAGMNRSGTSAQLNYPTEVPADPHGNVIIADEGRSRRASCPATDRYASDRRMQSPGSGDFSTGGGAPPKCLPKR